MGRGFAYGEGNPLTARIALCGEALGVNEAEEGHPFWGKAGKLLEYWILNPVGLNRADLFIDNGLRCWPPKNKQGDYYPIGDDREAAEKCCRQYDKWTDFSADCSLVTIHPAALLRSETPLTLVLEDFRKAKRLAAEGYKVRILLGAKAAAIFLPYVTEVLKWRGHVHWHKEEKARPCCV